MGKRLRTFTFVLFTGLILLNSSILSAEATVTVNSDKIGGPSAQAMRQPTGVLSGVTIFVGAGHGWTADTNGISVAENPVSPEPAWSLQRPVLLGMTEDYGNIAQLNYMVAYAFNAGATVVPLRPAGDQVIEVVLDNDDPGVTFTGSWIDTNGATATHYYENNVTLSGIPFKTVAATTNGLETATAKFTPTLPTADFYPVYCWSKAGTNRTRQLYRVKHSGGITEVVIDHRNVGNGWIWLGEYYFDAGTSSYVEISNQSTDTGLVVADAIRFGVGMGDVVRPLGTNGFASVSGYPRSEEAQRYWAESEWGNNAVGFNAEDLWDSSGSDNSDNVSCGGRLARAMNEVPAGGVMVDRWKRIHLEFHTNATNGANRGSIALITNAPSGPTTYQTEYANILSDELDGDILLIDDEFEHQWYDRSAATYTSEYGAIKKGTNDDEFDATILESGFHDNQQDAELLRDSRFRAAVARASLHGIIKFLHTLPGSEITLDFPPDTPKDVAIEDLGSGDVRISWIAPDSGEAEGDPATGYVIYASTNGYGFGQPIELGDVTSHTISGIPVNKTMYYRVAATNAGGESMSSEVVTIRRITGEDKPVLIVNGFDRLRRQQNPILEFTQPAGYAGLSIERPIWRRSNSFDYVVQYAEALEATGKGFVSCSNETVINGVINLSDYDVVIWILGQESTEDSTLDSIERSKVRMFLEGGGGLFISGSDIGYDLFDQGSTSFLNNNLQSSYVADDAGTFDVTGSGGILSDIGAFDFDPANGVPYRPYNPDELAATTDSEAILTYVGGTGGVAGTQYDFCLYRTVVFGFPFEAITSQSSRSAIMTRVIDFLSSIEGVTPFDYLTGFDYGADCDVDLDDYLLFGFCFQGPDTTYAAGNACLHMDGDGDSDVDLQDFYLFQQYFTGAQ